MCSPGAMLSDGILAKQQVLTQGKAYVAPVFWWRGASAITAVTATLIQCARVQGLAKVRSTLRERMLASPLCDGKGFVMELEGVYNGSLAAMDRQPSSRDGVLSNHSQTLAWHQQVEQDWLHLPSRIGLVLLQKSGIGFEQSVNSTEHARMSGRGTSARRLGRWQPLQSFGRGSPGREGGGGVPGHRPTETGVSVQQQIAALGCFKPSIFEFPAAVSTR